MVSNSAWEAKEAKAAGPWRVECSGQQETPGSDEEAFHVCFSDQLPQESSGGRMELTLYPLLLLSKYSLLYRILYSKLYILFLKEKPKWHKCGAPQNPNLSLHPRSLRQHSSDTFHTLGLAAAPTHLEEALGTYSLNNYVCITCAFRGTVKSTSFEMR